MNKLRYTGGQILSILRQNEADESKWLKRMCIEDKLKGEIVRVHRKKVVTPSRTREKAKRSH